MLIREQELKGEYLISIQDRMEEGQWTALPDGRAVLLCMRMRRTEWENVGGVGSSGGRMRYPP